MLNGYTNAIVTIDGAEYQLLSMGAIVTNKADVELTYANVDGVYIVDVFAKYLCDLTSDSAGYAVRVKNIPDKHKDSSIYVRAYFIIEVEGERVVVYADEIIERNYNAVLNG